MAAEDSNKVADEVIGLVKQWGRDPDCVAACTQKYKDDLDKCDDDDPDCAARAIGRYVLCVRGCRKG